MFHVGRNAKGVIVITLAAAFVLLLGYHAASRKQVFHPTRADFAKIRLDMTETEVERILGPPHEVHTWDAGKAQEFNWPFRPDHKELVYHSREDENSQFDIFDVTVDDRGRVCGRGFDTKRRKSLVERLINWF
jgi:hypothetical protein